MPSPAFSIALFKDETLPRFTHRLETLVLPLQRRLRSAGANVRPFATRVGAVQFDRIGKAVKGVAPFVRANPLLTLGVAAGAGLLLGLVSIGVAARARSADR